MDAISQTTFSNAFSWKKLFEFRLKFHWSLFLRVQLLILHHWFRQWLGAGPATSHCLNQWWLVYWCIYASLGLNELIKTCTVNHSGDDRLEYSRSRLVLCLLMPWLLAASSHQQLCYWPWRSVATTCIILKQYWCVNILISHIFV